MLPPTGVTSRCDRCDSPSPRLPGARGEPKSALHVEPQHPPDTLHRYPPRWPPRTARRGSALDRAHTCWLWAHGGAHKRPVRDHGAALAATPPTPYCRITGGLQPPHTTSLALPVTPVTPVVTLLSTDARWCLTDRDNQASCCASPSAPSLPQTLSRIVVSFRRPTSERARSRCDARSHTQLTRVS